MGTKAKIKKEEERQDGSRLPGLMRRLDKLITAMEAIGLEDYLEKRRNRGHMLVNSFVMGIARGVGMAVGFTLLGAVLFLLLQRIATANLPIIGDFIAQIVDIVERRG